MSKVKLMIEIPEQAYKFILQYGIKDAHEIDVIIANGTPITEGDLISRGALKKAIRDLPEWYGDDIYYSGVNDVTDLINNAPSIGGNQNE